MENDEYKAMSRQEQLQQTAAAYTSQMCKNCSAMLSCEEKNRKCVERHAQEKVFADGAKWSDQHPINIWHQADEEPQGKYEILVQDEFGHFWLTDYVEDISHYQNGWKECAASECIIRWAYISDILPKGGKE